MQAVQSRPSLPVGGFHLGLEEFYSKFAALFAGCKSDFFKVERLQAYQEPNNPSYVEYFRGNLELSRKLLIDGLVTTADFYQDTADRNLRWTRVRLVELPLTDYLKWEFMSYQVSARYGERILVKDITQESRDGVLRRGCDFIMFDSEVVLRNDYDPSGLLRGGWLHDGPADVQKFVEFGRLARIGAVPLAKFEHQHGI